jgi:hypothetical protein
MSRKPRNSTTAFQKTGVITQKLPVLVTQFGELVPFVPNMAIGGCTCYNSGRESILLCTADSHDADQVLVDGEPIGRLAKLVVKAGTEIVIGQRIGRIRLSPVETAIPAR